MVRKYLTHLVVLFFCVLFVFPGLASASTDQLCDDNSPNGKPVLVSAVANQDSVSLTWTKAQDPVTHYLVAYGLSPTEVLYGNPNIGNKDTTTYTVGNLEKGVKYYFKVKAVNGCRPGDFSNKLSATPGVVKKIVGHTPNLSIYKTITPSPEATVSAKTEEKNLDVLPINNRCTNCVSWPLLIIEAGVLVIFLFLSEKTSLFKPIFSLLIPTTIYILFWKINQGCPHSDFFCKYFLPLEVIIFIVTEIAYKNLKNK